MERSDREPRIIRLPKIEDPRGNLTFVQQAGGTIDFDIKRCYWIFDVPAGAERGGHSHLTMHQLLVATTGSFNVNVSDGFSWRHFTLNRPYEGLLIPPGIWRTLNNFSSGAVCLSIVSTDYNEADYVRDYDRFCKLRAEVGPLF